VIELQMRKKGYDDYDCGKGESLGPSTPYVTLIRAEVNSQRCPYLGKYMASGVGVGVSGGGGQPSLMGTSGDLCTTVGGGSGSSSLSGSGPQNPSYSGSSSTTTNSQQSQHGAFHSVVVGCGQRATMDFHSKCVSQEPITCESFWLSLLLIETFSPSSLSLPVELSNGVLASKM
jgi:hypothetical protein